MGIAGSPHRVGMVVRGLLALGLVATFVPPLSSSFDTEAIARTVPDPLTVRITDDGFVPSAVSLAGGQVLRVVNETTTAQSFTTDDGWMDSGAIPPDGRFVLATPSGTVGSHRFASSTTPAFTGSLTIGLLDLPGSANASASTAIPGVWAPTSTTVDVHPDFGILASRNRAIIGFTPSATVGAANTALADAGVTVVGGLPKFGLWAVEVPDSGVAGDFDAIDEAVASLEASPVVRFASLDVALGESARVPTPEDPPLLGPQALEPQLLKTVNDEPAGMGGDHGLESSQMYQSFNLRDAVHGAANLPETLIIDRAFAAGHPDAPAEVHTLCDTLRCTELKVGNHGTLTASLIGSPYRDVGSPEATSYITGANPVAKMHIVGLPQGDGEVSTLTDFSATLGLVLDNRATEFPRLRVIDMPLSGVVFKRGPDGKAVRFIEKYGDQLCGPGLNDDNTNPSVPCTPANLDVFRHMISQVAEAHRAAVNAAAQANILLVVAAGNESGPYRRRDNDHDESFCVPYNEPDCTSVDLPSESVQPIAQLAKNWGSGTPPTLIVESSTARKENVGDPVAPSRDPFSNTGGDISAPGELILAASMVGDQPGIGDYTGTSAASAYVTGVAGYLAALSPSSNYASLRGVLIRTARGDVIDGAPRLNAAQAVMALPGSTLRMVDINDPSPDGNQRVARGLDGSPLGEDLTLGPDGRAAAPDGNVDLRDLRRYRDAVLQLCKEIPAGLGCPDPDAITLDGAAENPHRDLNLDGCVFPGPDGCSNSGEPFARADFNGDGSLQPFTEPVPINPATGAPSTVATEMTDLDVLRSMWGTGPAPATGNWSKDSLDDLLLSADVHVPLTRVFASGASSVELSLANGPARSPVVTATDDAPLVLTMPVTSDEVQLIAKVNFPDGSSRGFVSSPRPAAYGSDQVIEPCAHQAVLKAPAATVTAHSTMTLEFTYGDCKPTPDPANVEGHLVTFSIVSGDGTLETLSATTDAEGKAQTELTVGDAGALKVKAAVNIGTLVGSSTVDLTVVDQTIIWYQFRQTNLEYGRTSTNEWGALPDDCNAADDPNNAQPSGAGCFESILAPNSELPGDDNVSGFVRTGSVTADPDGSGATVSELGRHFETQPDGYFADVFLDSSTTRTKPDGAVQKWDTHPIYGLSPTEEGGGKEWFRGADEDPVDDVKVSRAADGSVVVENFNVLAGRDYPYSYRCTPDAGSSCLTHPDDTGQRIPPRELMMMNRLDGSSLQHDYDTSEPLRIQAKPDGTFEPYHFCGVVDRDFTGIGPGYWTNSDPDANLRYIEARAPARTAGSRAAPIYGGRWAARMEFVAIATTGAAPDPEDFDFTPCNKVRSDLLIGLDQAPAEEGVEATLNPIEQGDFPGAAYSWTFGDGGTSDDATVTHTWQDSGTYEVTLTRVEADGEITVATRDVAVANLPPVLIGTSAVNGTPPAIHATIDDQGPVDRQGLLVSVASQSGGFVAPPATYFAAGDITFPLPAQAPGSYLLKVTVKDKEGATSTEYVTLFVPAAGAGGGGGSGLKEPLVGGGSVKGLRSVEAAPADPKRAHREPAATAPAAEPAVPGTTPAVLTDEVVSAFVVSADATTTGGPITVRNVSRSGGDTIAATLDPGDGRVPVPIDADATMSVTWLDPATFTLSVTGNTSATEATLPITVTGPSLAPVLTYTGATSAAGGELVTVRARLATPAGVGVGARTITFGLDGAEATAVTGPDGVATSTLQVASPPGARTLTVDAAGTSGSPARHLDVPFTVSANTVPTADAKGPYDVGLNGALLLDGTGTDPDPGQTATLQYAWDLDGDGSFADDAALGTGAAPPPIAWADVQAVVCGGTCALGDAHEITLRATDSAGGSDTDVATVRILRDFGISLSPSSAVLVPGAAVSFEVAVTTGSGFDQPVTLSHTGLPSGITGSFSTNPVTPDGTSLFTVKAPANATAQDIDLVVKGTSGSLVRQAGGAIDLEFGLKPACFGKVTGRVVDRYTGLPLAGVIVNEAITDANGTYLQEDVPVAADNGPRGYSFTLRRSGYWDEIVGYTVACDLTTTYDFAMDPIESVSFSGTVKTPDGAPVAAASVSSGSRILTTPANGTFATTFELPKGAQQHTAGWIATKSGYAPDFRTFDVEAGGSYTEDFVLVPECTTQILVRALDVATGKPVPGARVTVRYELNSGFTRSADATADASGRALVAGLGMNPGTSQLYTVSVAGAAAGPPTTTVKTDVRIASCGITVPIDVNLTFPREIRATLESHVIDDETGAPIAGAAINVAGVSTGTGPAKTDAGGVSVWNTRLGYGAPTSKAYTVSSSLAGYLVVPPNSRSVTLTDGQTTVTEFRMQKRRYGSVEGLVFDQVTGLPVANVVVTISGARSGTDVTDAEGRYRFDDVPLGVDGAAALVNLRTPDITGRYWSRQVSDVSVGPGVTTQDLDLLPVCTGSTIRGRVINADTRDPIPAATVSGSGLTVSTDDDGRFTLSPIYTASGNRPRNVNVTASKAGFVSATKQVTVFCGADIVLDFGTDADGSGTITGTVTDAAGDPVSGAFVGTGFGGSATTSATGTYTILSAPAGPGGGPRDWSVTVTPPSGSGLAGAVKTATVSAGTTATVDFTLGEPANSVPVAIAGAVSTAFETGVDITLSGFDADGDDLTFDVTDLPDHGTLSGTAPDLTYTPDDGYSGEDALSFTVSDGEDTSAAATITITVGDAPNQPPVADLVTGSAAPEGSSISLSAEGSTDPDGTITAYEWDLDGDGAYDDATGAATTVGAPDDGPLAVAVRVTDDDDATDVAGGEVTFTNADPVVTIGSVVGPDGAGVLTGSGSFTDPGSADTHTATVDYGDGGGPGPLALTGNGFTLGHTYTEAGAHTVTVEVCDDDEGCGQDAERLTFTPNSLPTAVITATSLTAPEGSTIDLSGADSTDTDGTVDGYEWDIDGDGQYDDATGPLTSFDGIDDTTFAVGLRVTDDRGDVDTTSTTLSFTNVAPAVAVAGVPAPDAAGRLQAVGTFSDPGIIDTHAATVDWDDGGPPEPLDLGDGTFGLDHTFAAKGAHHVVVEVCDDDEGCGQAAFDLIVPNRRPVASGLEVTTSVDEPVDTTLGAIDPDGDPLTFAIADPPDHGTVSGEGSARTYTPDAGYTGPDSFTYTAADGELTSQPATALITVSAGNQSPLAVITGATSAVEGDEVDLDASSSTDGDGTVDGYAWDLDDDGDYDDADGPTVTVTRDDQGEAMAAVEVTDDDGATDTATHTVSFANAAPSVSFADDLEVTGSGLMTRTGSFTDPGGSDQHTATVDWGDGDGPGVLGLDGKGFSLEHQYDLPAAPASLRAAGDVVRTVVVEVCDEDACAVASFPVKIAAPPPPSADLGVAVAVPGSFTVGETGTYVVKVTNAGPDAAEDLVATLTLPAGVEPLSASATPWWTCTVVAQVVTCERDVLNPGSSTIEVDVVFTAVGASLEAAAAVSSSTDDPDAGNDNDVVATAVRAPATTTSTEPSTTSTDVTSTTGASVATDPGAVGSPNVSGGAVARTGTDARTPLLVGLGLIAVGSVAVLTARRKRQGPAR